MTPFDPTYVLMDVSIFVNMLDIMYPVCSSYNWKTFTTYQSKGLQSNQTMHLA